MNTSLLGQVAAALMTLLPLVGTGCGSGATGGDAGTEPPGSEGGSGSGGTTPPGSGGSGGASTGTGGTATGTGGRATGGVNGSGGVAGGAGRGGGGVAGNAGGAGQSGAGVVAAGVRWVGRVDLTDASHPRFSWSGSGFVARFSGTGLSIQITNVGGAPFLFKPVVDGAPAAVKSIATGQQQTATIATGLAAGTHTVELYRQTEGSQGDSQLMAITVAGGALVAPPPAPARLIEVVGDSITCGYGTLGTLADSDCFPTESHWDTYEAVAARALGADVSTIAMSGQGAYRNYGGDMNNTLPMVYTRALTNDASPAWDFRTQPQAVVVNLGTNDISKGDPGVAFETAYTGLLASIRSKNPGALIVCIIGPLLNGSQLTTMQGHIRNSVSARVTAGDHNVEFFDQVAAQSSDNAACQYHPNPAENQIMATQIAAELRARLGW